MSMFSGVHQVTSEAEVIPSVSHALVTALGDEMIDRPEAIGGNPVGRVRANAIISVVEIGETLLPIFMPFPVFGGGLMAQSL